MIEHNSGEKDRTKIPLSRVLGLFTGILLVAGTMIGSGVFKKIIPMSQTGLNEAWIVMAWVVAGLITMCCALALTGLSNLTEETGGVYEYLRLSFGNFVSFLFGWTDFSIIGTASIAALAYIFAQAVNIFFPLANPIQSLSNVSILKFIYPFADSGIKLLAIATIVLLTWVNYTGVKKGGMVNNIVTCSKVAGMLLLIILGLTYNHPGSIAEPAVAVKQGMSLTHTALMSAFFGAMLSAFWAYDGWINISFVTGEIKNPKRNIPLAIMIGVGSVMLIYVLVNYAYMKVLPLSRLASVGTNNIGAMVVAETILGKIGKVFMGALIMVSSFGSLNGMIMAHTRVYYRMAQEGYFFKQAAKVHPKHRTPYVSLIYTMIWGCVLVISGTFDSLTDMVIFAGFLFYGLIAAALIKMKRNGSIKADLFGYPVLPIVVCIFASVLILNTIIVQPAQSLFGIILILIGVPVYFYFRRRSKLSA
jgi:basic amino acid/polyamine antiporter, APA family